VCELAIEFNEVATGYGNGSAPRWVMRMSP